jgi:DNA adenine methylase
LILRRVGGKKTIAEKIVALFPSDYTRNAYAEPYFGAGWVFWKKRRSKFEWINDIDLELMNFWITLRDKPEEVMLGTSTQIQHQEIMCQYLKQVHEDPIKIEDMPNVKRAVQYMVINKASFNGFVGNRSRVHVGFGCKEEPLTSAIPLMQGLATRLEGTRIVSQDALRFTRRTTKVKKIGIDYCLHYLDPPYIDVYADYPPENWDHVVEQVKLIDKAKDLFVLSINDHPLSRELAKGYESIDITKFHSVKVNGDGFVNELLIHNLGNWYKTTQTRLDSLFEAEDGSTQAAAST